MSFIYNRVARMLFALPFGIFGIIHFMMGSDMAAMVPDFLPGGDVWVYLTGVALLAACICFVIQKYVFIAGILLALMLIIFATTIHLPNVMAEDPSAMPNLLKDLSLAGGALLLAGKYADESKRFSKPDVDEVNL